MRFLLLSFIAAWSVTAHAQFFVNTSDYQGDYLGIAVPSPRCSNERLTVNILVESDGTLRGTVFDWMPTPQFEFESAWPFFTTRGKFTSDVSGLGTTVKGTFSKSGTIKGTVKVLNGCSYTFTAWRRYRVAQ